MINDITMYEPGAFGEVGTRYWQVKANQSAQGTGSSYTPAFRAGEPVIKTLGTGTTNSCAQIWAAILTGSSAKPVVATDFMAGIAISGQGGACSTETDTANGYVLVQPLVTGAIYLMNADNATTYGTGSTPNQGTYNALIGSRVLIKMSADAIPKFTVLASDSATSGLVVEYVDVTKYPGKVAVSFRAGLAYTT